MILPSSQEFELFDFAVRYFRKQSEKVPFPKITEIEKDLLIILDQDYSPRQKFSLKTVLLNHFVLLEFQYKLYALTTTSNWTLNCTHDYNKLLSLKFQWNIYSNKKQFVNVKEQWSTNVYFFFERKFIWRAWEGADLLKELEVEFVREFEVVVVVVLFVVVVTLVVRGVAEAFFL